MVERCGVGIVLSDSTRRRDPAVPVGQCDPPALGASAALSSVLQQIFADGQNGLKTQVQVAQAIADAIDAFVKSGTVTTTVTGTDSLGGPVVGAGTGSVG